MITQEHKCLQAAILVAKLHAIQQGKTIEAVLFDSGFYPKDYKQWLKGIGYDRAVEFTGVAGGKLHIKLQEFILEETGLHQD